MAVVVKQADVQACGDAMAIAPHPMKGKCLFALRDLKAGEVLLRTKLAEIRDDSKSCETIEQVRALLASLPDETARQRILEHMIPTKNGIFLYPQPVGAHNYFNHEPTPNCEHRGNDWHSAESWETVTLRDISAGEELTVDYDHCSGYDCRIEEPKVAAYVALCAEHGVEKRPSVLTLPGSRIVVEP
mmetsp:Transcript_63569/g.150626  ORF Transcript_63569/g.150626 Transcript_63569/m.150626 type:complete len:187 (+) Transcript_63569:87-647(+)